MSGFLYIVIENGLSVLMNHEAVFIKTCCVCTFPCVEYFKAALRRKRKRDSGPNDSTMWKTDTRSRIVKSKYSVQIKVDRKCKFLVVYCKVRGEIRDLTKVRLRHKGTNHL